MLLLFSADFFSKLKSNSLDLLVLIWVQTVCIDYQQITKVAARRQRVKEDSHCVLPFQEIKSYQLKTEFIL